SCAPSRSCPTWNPAQHHSTVRAPKVVVRSRKLGCALPAKLRDGDSPLMWIASGLVTINSGPCLRCRDSISFYAEAALFPFSHRRSKSNPNQQSFRRNETTYNLAPRFFLVL